MTTRPSAPLRGLCAAGLGITLVLSFATPARAQATGSPAAVQVVTAECPDGPVSLPDFVRALRVELAADGTRCCHGNERERPAAELTRVMVAIEPCERAAGRAVVSVSSGEGAPVRREITFDDVERQARPRALALAVAELLRTSREASPPPAAPPSPAAAGDDGRTTNELRSALSLSAGAMGVLRSYPSRHTTLWGAGVSAAVHRPLWRLESTLDFTTGGQAQNVGTIRLRALSVGLAGGPQWTLGQLVIGTALTTEVGWVWISGESREPTVRTASGSGPGVALRVRLGVEGPVGRRLRARALVEGGVAVRGLDGYVDDRRAAGTTGLSALVAVGLRYGGD